MVETRLERIGLSASFGLKIQCLSRILRRIIQLGARRVDVETPRADQSSQRRPVGAVPRAALTIKGTRRVAE